MRKKIFISAFEIKDIGGISTSVYNFIRTIAPYYDIDLCVLTNFITNRYRFPDNVRIFPFSSLFEDVYGDKKRIKTSLFGKIRLTALRTVRKMYGYERMLPLVMKSTRFEDEYDVGIAFWNDLYNAKGVMKMGGDYFNIIHNVRAKQKIAWVHNDAKQLGFTQDICKRIFKDFDAIVNVSYDCKSGFDKMIPEYEHKSYVVYNCYSIDEIKTKMNEENPFENNGKLHFVTVCRMNEQQKRVSRIVEACKRLKCEGYNNFDWTVVGDGADKATYESKSQANGTTDILHFVGLKTNPYPYMKQADAFILSSLYEGFGMTIREAQITGTPTFSTRFGAAEEAIEVGKQGEICDNSTEGLYSMVKRILDEPSQLGLYRQYIKDHPVTNDISKKQFESIINKI